MNRKRTKQIVFRVSEEEYQQIKDKIFESGKSQQEYITRSLLNQKITRMDGIKEVWIELKRQGVNLNQMVKKLNETGYIDYRETLPTLERELSDTWQLLRLLIQKHL